MIVKTPMYKWISVFGLLLVMHACERKHLPAPRVVADSVAVNEETKLTYQPPCNEKVFLEFALYYNGPEKDTLLIGERMPQGINGQDVPAHSCIVQTDSFLLMVDTVSNVHALRRVEPYALDEGLNQVILKNYSSFPIIIKNNSAKPLHVGPPSSMRLALQVLKVDGVWKTVNQTDEGMDDLGAFKHADIQPGHIGVTLFNRFTGDTVAPMRLAFYTKDSIVYSNVFRDSIDRRVLH